MWEWPETCDLWKDWRVRALTSSQGYFVPVSASAVGWTAFQKGKVVTIKKRWRLWTTHPSIAAAFTPYQQDLNASAKTFVQCSGTVAKNSAHYPQKFAEILWRSQCGARNSHGGFLAGRSAASPAWDGPHGWGLGAGHRELDSRPTMPPWCSLITRVVKPKSAEVRCAGAEAALRKELANMDSKKVWDTDDVFSLKDFLHHPNIPEAMLGRVFCILGVKNEELGEAIKAWEARCVFQGSNVRTKTGTSAADLFEETSNAPASFAAARAALGVAALKGFNASLRDAETAYLQAVIDTPTRI